MIPEKFNHNLKEIMGWFTLADSMYWLNWGIAIAARMPMMAMTISSSMSVKPDVFLCVECFCMTISYKKILENDNFIGVEICVVNKVR